MIDKRINWVQVKKIYEFESSKISGPGSYKRDIQSNLWSLKELQEAIKLQDLEVSDIEDIIQSLIEKREIMKVPLPNGEIKYITRVAETVRLLGHNYEYWFRGRQGIDSVRWLVEDKKVPIRDIPAPVFLDALLSTVAKEIGSDNSTLNLRKAIEITIKGIGSYFNQSDWKKAKFSEFQLQSAKEMILSEFKPRYRQKTQVLIAGVGSGKTVAFSIAMFVSTIEGILSGERSKRCNLFLYPRKALAYDQSKILKKIAERIGLEQLTVHFEHHYHYNAVGMSVKAGIESTYGKPGAPPSIIVTTLETLNRRLHHPLVISKLSHYLKRVVLDEIHLIEGIPGCHVIRLVDRLKVACLPNNILWTGASATVANPDLHASTVFGTPREDVKIIEPSQQKYANVGLVHHVFLRPSGSQSFLGTLVNSTSIVVHNRREKIWERTGEYPKTIGFADNLDLLGRWNSDFRENERTENAKNRPHPENEKPSVWASRQQREIPYALRFFKPLERRINLKCSCEGYEPALQEFKDQEICSKCKEGERLVLKSVKKDELEKLATFVIRENPKDGDKLKVFHIRSNVFEADELEVGTLDLCPYLNAGACFWFARDDLGTEEILKGSKPKWEWRSVARSKVHSSKTSTEIGIEDDLSELVFKATRKEVYDVYSDEQINIDVVLASPSLEVGVDLKKVTESLMFKAIRNVASYRQKAGRVGREEDTNSLNATLLSLRPIDLHYYRQPRKIISQAQLEPIPLKEHNDSVLRSALYMAVWDFLALRTDIPEVIPLGSSPSGKYLFTEKLKISRAYLDSHNDELSQYLSNISRGTYLPSNDLITGAIRQVADELDVLLASTVGVIDDPKISCLSDLVVRFLNSNTAIPPAPSKSPNMEYITFGAKSYENIRPSISPIKLDLSEEFMVLDRMSSYGWIEPDAIMKIEDHIKVKIDELKAAKDNDFQMLNLLRHALETIVMGLQGMISEGQSPLAVYFYQQYDKFRTDNKYLAVYLSYTLQGLPLFGLLKRHPAFTTPATLFINPYEPSVVLNSRDVTERQVLASEALFSFIPGTWTYRLGKNPIKTQVGRIEPREGGVLIAKLAEMERQGNSFVINKKLVPAPPGFPSKTVTVYTPTKLALKQCNDKYVSLNEKSRTIMDKDEDYSSSKDALNEEELDNSEEEFSPGKKRVKIPESFLQRWVHVVSNHGERILLNDVNQGEIIIENEDKGLDARKKIIHPMFAGILEAINWHEKLEVCDYVCAVSRTYTSKTVGAGTLLFRDSGGNMGFGYYFNTEGVSIDLSAEAFERAVEKIKSEMAGFNNKWAPSIVKILKAALSSKTMPDGSEISPIKIDELIGIIVSASPNLNAKTLFHLPDTLKNIIEDKEAFRNSALIFYQGKMKIQSIEKGEESDVSEQDAKDIEYQVSEITKLASAVADFKISLAEGVDDWITQTLLNTFGLVSLSALQRLCGSEEENIGYTIDTDGLKNKKYRVYLYDRTPHGNGSSGVLKRYLHIINIQRHKQTDLSRLLPTEDFLSILEQELLQCPQFHTDMDALEKHAQISRKSPSKGLPELGYISNCSDEVLSVCRETWLKLGIEGRDDAWKLPLIALSPGIYSQRFGIEIDNLIRASNICWNGCPECVISNTAIIGFLGTAFVDKLVLDEWFETARAQVKEYKTLSVADVAEGKSRIDIGRQTKVCIELSNRKIRSISLPFTIGFVLNRCSQDSNASLLVRDSDIHGFRVFDDKYDGCAHGIESLGFKRIMWYNLMMSAYVDILGLLEPSRKEITLVFYDCRDVGFDDIGISNRMMEAIEYHRRKAGLNGEIRNLSDILIWLEKAGFKISICVDENRTTEMEVHAFFEKLAGASNINLRVKGLNGSMHKKALVSPLGIIHGSANLTFSGTQNSEEVISYAPYSTSEYNEMRLNILDTFHGSKPWVK